MCLLPFVVPSGYLRTCIFANFTAIFAMSWDILSGYAGYVSFGHPVLIGAAGYTTAMLTYHLGMPLYFSIPLAVLVGLAAGMLFFFPALRLRGNYFCLVTLAWGQVTHSLVIAIRPDLTGGTRGLAGLPYVVTGAVANFYLSFGIMFLVAAGLWYVAKSDLGAVLNAIRLDEDAVSAAGLSTLRFKLFAFTLSALTAGIGGAFYVHYTGSIAPESVFSTTFLLTMIVAVLLGGQNSIIGPIIGAYFLTFLLESLRPYIAGTPRFLLYSAIALGLYVYKVRGFYGIIQDIANWNRERRRKTEEHA
jgi:branched-chain amino acid transport system permease protein